MCSNNTLLSAAKRPPRERGQHSQPRFSSADREVPSCPSLSSPWAGPSTVTALLGMESKEKCHLQAKVGVVGARRMARVEHVQETLPRVPALIVHPMRWSPEGPVEVKANGCAKAVVSPEPIKHGSCVRGERGGYWLRCHMARPFPSTVEVGIWITLDFNHN